MSRDSELSANILPFTGSNAEIEIYIVTGFHGLIRIPESFCKECHLFVRSAQEASEHIDEDIGIE